METGTLNRSLREVLDAVAEGVYVTTASREIIFWNKGAEKITGYASEDVLGKHCYDNILVHTDTSGRDLCLDGCPLQKCIETGQRQDADHIFLRRKDGERVAVYVKASILEIEGQCYGVEVFGELREVAGKTLADKLQQLSTASIIDELTSLYNRRYVDTILDQQYGLFKRHYQRFGIVMIDVDGFKEINDSFGHLTGNEVLRTVAAALKIGLRSMDVLGRFGGDEFIIVCPLIELEGLERLSERIVHAVQHAVLSSPDGVKTPREVTVSTGASMIDYKDKSASDVIARADEALYRVKRDGGNWYALN